MALELRLGYGDRILIKELFTEYTDFLVESDPKFAAYLKLQHYDSELELLNIKYGFPKGRLYIALVDGEAAGCIGLRYLDPLRCEMKRLYVRPRFRGQKIARQLVKLVVDDAKSIGYAAMVLDTLSVLRAAIALYKTFGFYEIPSYNNSPVEETIFMQLDLANSCGSFD